MMDQEKVNTLDIIDQASLDKEKSLKALLKRLENDLLRQNIEIKDTIREQITKTHNDGMCTKPQVLDRMIPFGDQANRLLAKVANAIFTKATLSEVNLQVAEHVKMTLTKEDALEAKKKFDLICDYDRRKKEGMDYTGEMYDEKMCLYLMSKTFKKSSTDAFESYYRILTEVEAWKDTKDTNADIFIGAIGGGPGSDLSGSVSFLTEICKKHRTNGKWNLEIFDIMNENWKAASEKALRFGFYRSTNELKMLKDETVKYSHIDFKNPNSVPTEALAKFDFLTVCWALNEAVFNEEFWRKVIQAAPQAFIIFVEGVDDQLDQIKSLADTAQRKTIYEKYESPRRLIIHPVARQDAVEPENQADAKPAPQ